jgi:hypothetical protein
MQWAVGEILVDTLRRLDLQLPVMDKARRRELVEGRRLLAAERPRRRG